MSILEGSLPCIFQDTFFHPLSSVVVLTRQWRFKKASTMSQNSFLMEKLTASKRTTALTLLSFYSENVKYGVCFFHGTGTWSNSGT